MISIVIPALNEENNLRALLGQIKSASQDYRSIQVLVADGGSGDSTLAVCNEFEVEFIRCPRAQRASQMNIGAAKSCGNILYFLHADSVLPKHFDQKIRSSLERGCIAGCFKMKFDEANPILSFYTWFTRFDLLIFRGGDQSLFINRIDFEKLGGFNEEMDLMEDYDIVKRIRETGRFEIVQGPIITSSRKYRKNGVVRLQFIYLLIQTMYYIGFSQRTLRAAYNYYIRN